MDPLIPSERREESVRGYAPQVLLGVDDLRVSNGMEAGRSDSGSDDAAFEEKKEGEDVGRTRSNSEDGKIRERPTEAADALHSKRGDGVVR